MIVSKPKINTLFSIGVFLSVTFGLFIYGFTQLREATNKTWWYLLIYTSGSIGLVVLIRILIGIKIIKIGKEKFEFRYPFKLRRTQFGGKDIQRWNNTVIKAYGGYYEELTIKLKSGKILSLSKQENTEYEKALGYMKKKFKKLKT